MSVSTIHESDREGVISTVVSAFVDDPVERWLFPDPEQYSRHFPEFVAAFASEAFDRRTVWTLGELSAVALRLPPDAFPEVTAVAQAGACPPVTLMLRASR